jgi:hypothetical protein
MLATFPCKHLENANESVTGDILVALRKGDEHRLDLLPKPLEEIR